LVRTDLPLVERTLVRLDGRSSSYCGVFLTKSSWRLLDLWKCSVEIDELIQKFHQLTLAVLFFPRCRLSASFPSPMLNPPCPTRHPLAMSSGGLVAELKLLATRLK
jgi:hypothetical protein